MAGRPGLTFGNQTTLMQVYALSSTLIIWTHTAATVTKYLAKRTQQDAQNRSKTHTQIKIIPSFLLQGHFIENVFRVIGMTQEFQLLPMKNKNQELIKARPKTSSYFFILMACNGSYDLPLQIQTCGNKMFHDYHETDIML